MIDLPVSGRFAQDRFSFRHSSDLPGAISAFEDAVAGFAGHLSSTGPAVQRALQADPDLVAAIALKGFSAVTMARAELSEDARKSLEQAQSAMARRGLASPGERTLVQALSLAVAGNLSAAAARLDVQIEAAPRDLLSIKLSHSLHFMRGEVAEMRAVTGHALEAWSPKLPGYGYLLGMHAFGLEESGAYEEAEEFARAAVLNEPGDAWGLNALGHVFDMQGRALEGAALLSGAKSVWSGCNNFRFHVAWHLALFLHAGGHTDAALALYDSDIRPQSTDDFRDVANAASFLWRMRQEGIAVGRRWEELLPIAERRRRDTSLVFASLHYLLALIANGALAAARDLVEALGSQAMTGHGDQARLAAEIGYPLAKAIFATTGHDPAQRIDAAFLATLLPGIGGSNAQRDVFVRTLALIAVESGDAAAAADVLALRRRLRRDDRFVGLVTGTGRAPHQAHALFV